MTQGKSRVAEIFSREKSRFLAFVERHLFDSDDVDAEDIVSDVALNLLRRADVVDEVENLTAYIYRSLANRVTDRHRQSVPTVRLDDTDQESESAKFELPDTRPRPDESFENRELRDQLAHAISELNDKERAVWIATEIDGRSFRELSEEWDEPIGTLLSRKSRATASLRKLLAEYKNY